MGNSSEVAFASYDSFLFGPDAKITTWDSPLSPEDLGSAAGSYSAVQGNLNQFTVDRYLARTFVELALTSKKKLEREKLFNLALKSEPVPKALSYASSMGQKSDLALRVFVLFELKKQGLAKQESMRLLDLFAQTKEEKSKVVYSAQALTNLAQRFERAGDISTSRYLQLVAAKIPAVSEPVNTTDIEVESLYQMGLVAAHAGKLDEAQEKLKQALELQEKTMSDRLLRAFDSRLALAKTAVALDRREAAQEHFNLVIDRLKQIPKTERPQTAELLGEFLQMLEVDLSVVDWSVVDWSVVDLNKISPNDKQLKLTTEQREKLLHGLNSLGVAAYLCKVDGDLVQAAHLFRRAYLINKYYFPELDVQLAATCYDLGETLYWDSHLEEAEHYMQEALRLREKNGRDCDDAINLRGTFGRVLIIGGRGEGACRFYIETLQLLAGKTFAKSFEQAKSLDLQQLIDGLTKETLSSDNKNIHLRSQFEDTLQSLADAAISCKQYDQAVTADSALLYLRELALKEARSQSISAKEDASKHKEAVDAARGQVEATLWQLGWITSMASSVSGSESSAKYYGRLIEEFPSTAPRPLADWYQARAISSDLLGRYAQAKSDFKAARRLFKKHLQKEKDQEQIDIVTWTIDDIKYNLDSRRKSPASDKDYLKAEPNSFWRQNRFPLKVFVETSASNGFGGPMRELMLKAMEQWTNYSDSPVKLTFVTNIDNADVYIERVTSYDDIPFSSAGRTSAVYEKDSKRALQRSHVRVYCPSYDGRASLADGAADKIENQAMTSFAKTQLYTLFMHEFGHVLGLGHSPGGQDVMYWKSCSTELTERDKETIRRLYRENKL